MPWHIQNVVCVSLFDSLPFYHCTLAYIDKMIFRKMLLIVLYILGVYLRKATSLQSMITVVERLIHGMSTLETMRGLDNIAAAKY